ncbi:hypothetical protein A3860_09355 [Niastella vici]|uniref:Uncharacterized protein n=1 Tax=Niastella vici TaxID=1703345 RepID=A0A1V9FHS8_9BACT|nr:hypothetical protein A3860_09355 [Niastella vici]
MVENLLKTVTCSFMYKYRAGDVGRAVSNLNSGTTQGKIRKPAEFMIPYVFLGLLAFWFILQPDKDKI